MPDTARPNAFSAQSTRSARTAQRGGDVERDVRLEPWPLAPEILETRSAYRLAPLDEYGGEFPDCAAGPLAISGRQLESFDRAMGLKVTDYERANLVTVQELASYAVPSPFIAIDHYPKQSSNVNFWPQIDSRLQALPRWRPTI